MAASLTYYAVVALAPLMVVFLAAVGLAFGSFHAREDLVSVIRLEIGDTGASVVKALIEGISKPKLGVLATLLGSIALFFGATSAFVDLKGSLKTIWRVPDDGNEGLGEMLLSRLVSFAIVLITGAVIVVSIFLSVGLAALHRYFAYWTPKNGALLAGIALSFLVATALFAVIYRIVPPERMPWRHIIFGATVTSILFTAGKAGIDAYIGSVGVGSPYGAAGSLFAFLIWLYYSAQVFFIGAIITRSRARADRIGEAIKQGADAVQVPSIPEGQPTP